MTPINPKAKSLKVIIQNNLPRVVYGLKVTTHTLKVGKPRATTSLVSSYFNSLVYFGHPVTPNDHK